MLKIFFFLNALIVCPIYGQSVDSLQPLNNKIKDSVGQLKHSLSPIFNKAIDSSFISVRQMEERFQNQLFSNDLFTALNDSIENQSVEVVYYPELSTDTLKKRLAILDAKTPFNIEYNPSLENVIKRHLKSRKTSTETLMRLSRYYFPMFEEVLGLKTILLGFGLDSDVIHSPNEHFGLFNFYKGIETIPHFYKNYANLML